MMGSSVRGVAAKRSSMRIALYEQPSMGSTAWRYAVDRLKRYASTIAHTVATTRSAPRSLGGTPSEPGAASSIALNAAHTAKAKPASQRPWASCPKPGHTSESHAALRSEGPVIYELLFDDPIPCVGLDGEAPP